MLERKKRSRNLKYKCIRRLFIMLQVQAGKSKYITCSQFNINLHVVIFVFVVVPNFENFENTSEINP